MNISKKIEGLKPYVTGIRFIEGLTLIDCSLKEGWIIPESRDIQFGQNTIPNYYMFYSENSEIDIDQLLSYVESIINFNIENEHKMVLFKMRVKDLELLFMENSLINLKRLEFFIPNSSFNEGVNEGVNEGINEGVNEGINNNDAVSDAVNDAVNNTAKPLELRPDYTAKRIPYEPMYEEKIITPVCRCVGSEQCSVCMGLE